ncbi:MAG: winged helix-turn-helix transcriptional regulator [Candidatus Micrarchaeia archaeon]
MNRNVECAPVGIAHLIGRKWFFPVMEEIALSKQGIGFNDLFRKVKYITPRDLVFLLESMQKYSLLKQIPASGKHKLYAATEKGTSLYMVMEDLKDTAYSGLHSGGKTSCKDVKCTDCKWYSSDYWVKASPRRSSKTEVKVPQSRRR